MPAAFEHWLSKNACSSSLRPSSLKSSSDCHWGLPEKSSPSQETLPASSAVRSVADTFGATFLKVAKIRGVSHLLRSAGRPTTATAAAAMSSKVPMIGAPNTTPIKPSTPSRARAAVAPASRRITTSKPATASTMSSKVSMGYLRGWLLMSVFKRMFEYSQSQDA